jgi:membrane protease YdiL (CAAX protease family)
MPYVFSIGFVFVLWLVFVFLGERRGLLDAEHFPSQVARYFAYAWLLLFLVAMAFLVTGSALSPATTKELRSAPFYSLFALHAILIVFLSVWWLAAGRPPLREFLSIRREEPLETLALGLSVGVGGWAVTIVLAATAAFIVRATGLAPKEMQIPPMIGWLAALPVWKKALIVLSAMTVEEAFFRAFLQKRVGLLASTILFALAHFTYGEPLLLIGVTIISLVIGLTFYRTKNVIPGMIAHGVFDAIQIFVIVPIAFRMMGGS